MQKGLLDVNSIEGMACVDGCIGGAGNLTHNLKNKLDVIKDSTQAYKTIGEAVEKSRSQN
jgi:iron only hydrogenase large subunit-like protein